MDKLSEFIVELQDFAKQRGVEIKTTKEGVALWPTYDKETGGLGRWFCLYVTTQETQQCK